MSDTPETDAEWEKLCCADISWYRIAEKMKAYCQEKERERDNAINDLEFRRELYKVQEQYLETARRELDDLAALLAAEKATRNSIIEKGVQTERERDEAREEINALREENNRLIELLRRDEKPIWIEGARRGTEVGIDMAIKCLEKMKKELQETK